MLKRKYRELKGYPSLNSINKAANIPASSNRVSDLKNLPKNYILNKVSNATNNRNISNDNKTIQNKKEILQCEKLENSELYQKIKKYNGVQPSSEYMLTLNNNVCFNNN